MSTHPEPNLSSAPPARLCPGLVELDGQVCVTVAELVELLQKPPFNLGGFVEVLFWRAIWRRERRASA